MCAKPTASSPCSTPTRRRGRARQGCGPRAQPAIAGYRMMPPGGTAGYYPITGLSRGVLPGLFPFLPFFGSRVIDNPATRGPDTTHTQELLDMPASFPDKAVCSTVEDDACFVYVGEGGCRMSYVSCRGTA